MCSKHSTYGNQFISFVQLCPTVCNPMDCSTPGLLVHHQFPELADSHVHGIPNAIQPSHPLSSPSSWPSFLPSIRIFSNETVLCIRWAKYWSCSFSVSSSSAKSGLIPHNHGVMAEWAQEGLEEFKVRSGVSDDIYLVQDKEQWLRFAGAALKRYHRSRKEKPT